jgi:dihydroorotate dehydrogenase
MGLPSEGALNIAEHISKYEPSPIPLTINFAATPTKKEGQAIEDLLFTIRIMKNIKEVDRFELNISCPNISAAKYEIKALDAILNSICNKLKDKQLFLKISPDMDKEYASKLISIGCKYKIAGFVIANTTKRYIKKYIPKFPSSGGASGGAVYRHSTETQRLFENIIEENNLPQKIIACGGIDSVKKAKERLTPKTSGIQIYTPFIFYGPKLIRLIKRAYE